MNLVHSITYWNPLIMILMACFIGVIIYIIYSLGNSSYKETKYRGEPFLSGNPPIDEDEKDKEPINIRGDNFYWGFITALKFYFKPLIGRHTGRLNDYIFWFMLTMLVVVVVLALI